MDVDMQPPAGEFVKWELDTKPKENSVVILYLGNQILKEISAFSLNH